MYPSSLFDLLTEASRTALASHSASKFQRSWKLYGVSVFNYWTSSISLASIYITGMLCELSVGISLADLFLRGTKQTGLAHRFPYSDLLPIFAIRIYTVANRPVQTLRKRSI